MILLMNVSGLKYWLLIGSIKPTRSAHEKRVRFRFKSCQHVSKFSNGSLSPRHRSSLKIMERSWIDPFRYRGIRGLVQKPFCIFLVVFGLYFIVYLDQYRPVPVKDFPQYCRREYSRIGLLETKEFHQPVNRGKWSFSIIFQSYERQFVFIRGFPNIFYSRTEVVYSDQDRSKVDPFKK